MLPLGGRHAQPASSRRLEPPCSPGVALAIIAIILIVFLVLLLIGSSIATSVFHSRSNGKELTISRPRRRERPPLRAKWRWPPESCNCASCHLESLDSVGQRRGPQPVRALSLPPRHRCRPSSEVVLKRAGKARDSASSRGSPPVLGQIQISRQTGIGMHDIEMLALRTGYHCHPHVPLQLLQGFRHVW